MAALSLLVGCAPPLGRPVRPSRVEDEQVGGVWDLVEQSSDADGDERIERQEWQLEQRDGEILGFSNRSVTWVSGDGMPFGCSGGPRYTEAWRYLLRGRSQPGGGRVEVTRWLREPGSCKSSGGALESCTLVRRGRRLLVNCGRGWLALQRRHDSPVPLDLAERRPGDLTGVWTWNLRSTDAEGDLKTEVETWQLWQRAGRLEGHYDRLVTVRSADGRRFQCNQQLSYSSRARFVVRGSLDGRKLRIEEVGFTAAPGSCESGYRSLDRYQGIVDEDGGIITLSWGRGAQLLYRRY